MDISSLCLSKLHIFPSFLQVAKMCQFSKEELSMEVLPYQETTAADLSQNRQLY
jgi:hypothetical protein